MKKRCRVRFKYIEVLYFSRCLGIDKVPEKGNNPLGMECCHFESEKIDIAKRKFQNNHFLAGDSLLNIKNLTTSTPKSSKSTSYLSEEDSESIHSIISIDFTSKSLQPMNPNQRKKCLESAGVDVDKKDGISKNPKNLSKLREGRKQVGCKCSTNGKCDSTKCICSSEGIPCQTDGNKFPCKCGDKCSNKFGKRTYSYAKMKFHYQHTLNRLPNQLEDVDINNLSTVNGDCTICSTVDDEIWNKHPEAYHQTRSRKREGDLLFENSVKLLKKHVQPSHTSNGFRDTSPYTVDRKVCSTVENQMASKPVALGPSDDVDSVVLASYPIINRRLSVDLLIDDAICSERDLPVSQHHLHVHPEDARYTNKENISYMPTRTRHSSVDTVIIEPIASMCCKELIQGISPIKNTTKFSHCLTAVPSPITIEACGDNPSNWCDEFDKSSNLYTWNSCEEFSLSTEQVGEHDRFPEYNKFFLNATDCSVSTATNQTDPVGQALLPQSSVVNPLCTVIFNTISLATPVVDTQKHDFLGNSRSSMALDQSVSDKHNCHGNIINNGTPLVSYLPSPIKMSSTVKNPSSLSILAAATSSPYLRTIRDAPNYVESPLDHCSQCDTSQPVNNSVIDRVSDITFFDIPLEIPGVVSTSPTVSPGNDNFLVECAGRAPASSSSSVVKEVGGDM